MANITYLLGAGASANALPLIKNNKDSNNVGLAEDLKKFVEGQKGSVLSDKPSYDYLIHLVAKSIEFGSPDLYAKFLLETGDDISYNLLKKLLSNYFNYKEELQQTGPNPSDQGCFDKRSLAFLTTITQHRQIPNNIKILSWNYDRQIETAAKKLKSVNSGGYNTVQGFTCWPNCQDGFDSKKLPFLLHLNGVAGYDYSEQSFAEKNKGVYNYKSPDATPLLSFAWEEESNDSKRIFHEQRLPFARELAAETEILVIIGYSFPFFNRKIDDEIFKAMKKTLTKIYFQDPISDGSQLKTQFDLKSDIKSGGITHISQKDYYHIPFEL